MATFLAGKTGRVSVNGATMAATRWSTTLHADELDTSNFESNGKKSWLIGLQGLDWQVGTLWDSAQPPFTDPPGLYMRDDGTSMNLYTKVSTNKYWSMPHWMCSNSSMEETVSGLVMFNASGKAQEDFSYSNLS